MTVLHEILDWSKGKGRPAWQRDALRLLVVGGELSDEDIRSLAEICKAAYGLAEPQEVLPLAREHIPDEGGVGTSVSLHSILHHRGVNALAENQTLRFSPRLTVVYGDNAAGKTGYIRILKSACRTRGQEEILGNVVSGAAPPAPVVAIIYTLGTDPEARERASVGVPSHAKAPRARCVAPTRRPAAPASSVRVPPAGPSTPPRPATSLHAR